MSTKASFYPLEILEKFDLFLVGKGLSYDGIIVGGAAVSLLSASRRFTQDIDVLTPITEDVKQASIDFAGSAGLNDEWFNNRVVNLESCKPHGWGKDTIEVFQGNALRLSSLSAQNLLRTKVYAFIDREEGPTIDLSDIKALNPDPFDLEGACNWAINMYKNLNRNIGKTELQEVRDLLDSLSRELAGK